MHKVYRFGSFELRPAERLFLKDGAALPLGGRAFDMLLLLVARRGEVVAREEVKTVVWTGVRVAENNLAVQAAALRQFLGRGAITTVKNRGYMFTLPVTEVQPARVHSPTHTVAPLVDPIFLDPEVVLLARSMTARGSDAWMTELRHIIVPEHGGRVIKTTDVRLAAVFAQARSAIACARQLLASTASPTGLRVALCSRHEYEHAARAVQTRARALDDLDSAAAPGAVAVSTQVAGRLIDALDGQPAAVGALFETAPAFRVPLQPSRQPDDGLERIVAPDGLPTVAVLPFRAYGQGGDHVGIGDIVADQLTTLLSRGSGLNITSWLSTRAFRERPYQLTDVARHLRADYVVSGRYVDSNGKLSVDVEVADARRGRVLAKHSAADATAAILHGDGVLLGLAGAITRSVLDVELEHRTNGIAMPDLRSHALLLTAVDLLYRLSPSDFEKAAQALAALRQRTPKHPAPLAWLSRWHLFKVSQAWSSNPDEDGRLAEAHARNALELEPGSALALTMLGNVHTSFRRDPAAAEAFYDQALASNPNESLAWLHKGNALAFRGEGRRALEHIEKAIDLSPLDPSRHFYHSLYAGAALAASDYERAVIAANAALRLNSRHASSYRVLAIAQSLLGRIDQARRAVAIVRRIEPELTVRLFIARSPGGGTELAKRFGEALAAAGLPRNR